MSSANKVVDLAKCALKMAGNTANRLGAANLVFIGLVGYAGFST